MVLNCWLVLNRDSVVESKIEDIIKVDFHNVSHLHRFPHFSNEITSFSKSDDPVPSINSSPHSGDREHEVCCALAPRALGWKVTVGLLDG